MKQNVCLIASAGGHLTELIRATKLLARDDFFLVTYGLPHVQKEWEGREVYYIVDPHVSFLKYIKNFCQSLVIYLRKRPRVVITTGAGIALAMCFLGKLFGSKIIVIESGARVYYPSRTARLLYHIADLFIVQWKPLLKYFPRAVYGGVLL